MNRVKTLLSHIFTGELEGGPDSPISDEEAARLFREAAQAEIPPQLPSMPPTAVFHRGGEEGPAGNEDGLFAVEGESLSITMISHHMLSCA